MRKEPARGRRHRAGLARRGLRESAGQRKAARRDRRPCPQHARLAGQFELPRRRRVCRATAARRLTNPDSWPRVTCPRRTWAVATQPGWVCWMKRKPTETGKVSRGPVCSPPGRVASSLVRITRRRVAARGRDRTAVSTRAAVFAHARGLDIGPQPTPTASGGGQAGGLDHTSRRVYGRVSHTVADSPEEPGGLHREQSVRRLWHTLSLQQEP